MYRLSTLFKRFSFLFMLIMSMNPTHSQTFVTLKTTLGDIRIRLYDETPLHKENFIKLVEQGFYNTLLFHRVIPTFMIQTGDPNSRNARPGQPLGDGGPGYTIPAEFAPGYFHKRGALAAARQADQVNPERKSSGSQFYIVQGRTFTEAQLNSLETSNRHAPFTAEERKVYTTLGGAPHLDGAYTVFGEVVEGIDVVDKIASVTADQRNRPYTDIKIIKALISQ